MRDNTGKPNTVGHRIKLHDHAMHRFVYLAFTFIIIFRYPPLREHLLKSELLLEQQSFSMFTILYIHIENNTTLDFTLYLCPCRSVQ